MKPPFRERVTFLNQKAGTCMAYIGHELAKELNIIRYIIDEEVLENLAARGGPGRNP